MTGSLYTVGTARGEILAGAVALGGRRPLSAPALCRMSDRAGAGKAAILQPLIESFG